MKGAGKSAVMEKKPFLLRNRPEKDKSKNLLLLGERPLLRKNGAKKACKNQKGALAEKQSFSIESGERELQVKSIIG